LSANKSPGIRKGIERISRLLDLPASLTSPGIRKGIERFLPAPTLRRVFNRCHGLESGKELKAVIPYLDTRISTHHLESGKELKVLHLLVFSALPGTRAVLESGKELKASLGLSNVNMYVVWNPERN